MMSRWYELCRRIRGTLNLVFGRAVNEDARRRATWTSWSDEDPTLAPPAQETFQKPDQKPESRP